MLAAVRRCVYVSAMNKALDRFFGGPPAWVLLRLAILSLIVGLVLSALGVSPYEIFAGIRRLIVQIYELGFDAIDLVWRYFLMGAVIVFPIWLIMRLIRNTRRGGE